MKGTGPLASKSVQGAQGPIVVEETGSRRLAVTFPRKDGLGYTQAICVSYHLHSIEIEQV